MADQIAFMVMPFGRKKVGSERSDAPKEVDFDALWRNVHTPVLKGLGFRPIRADADLGALIVNEMVQRLTIADLVVADISLANANVYYEVGVRHAAKQRGCVLVAADWAQPVFDLQQMRRLRYPLTDGDCGRKAAAVSRKVLRTELPPLIAGESPVFGAVPGYPDKINPARITAFEDLVDLLSQFETEVTRINNTVDHEVRRQRTLALLQSHGSRTTVREAVVLELIRLTRDNVGWLATLDYIDKLPPHLQRHPPVQEQRYLALAKLERVEEAAAALQQLITRDGPTSERYGLLGGRYKQLMSSSADSTTRSRYLDQATEAYQRGMDEDLNDYYPSSNLPRLYRLRGGPHDEERAVEVATIAWAACRRSAALSPDDPWILMTQLGVAFDRGDAAQARQLTIEVARRNLAPFYLETTLADLELSYGLQSQEARQELADVLGGIRSMIPN